MRRRIKEHFITILIVGIISLIVVVLSVLIFPGWKDQPAWLLVIGFIALMAVLNFFDVYGATFNFLESLFGWKEKSGKIEPQNNIEDISMEQINQSAVAVGGDATINVYHYGTIRKRPDYINMAQAPRFFVERPEEFNKLKQNLIEPKDGTVAISATAALRGAGGYGKTTIAQALCFDLEVQEAFPDGILWVELGEKPDNLPGKVNDLIYHLTGERPGLVDLNAAAVELANALGDKRCLLVIDDLWDAAHVIPFQLDGPACTRLIITRNADTLPLGTEAIFVEAMERDEALAMLVWKLPEWEAFEEKLVRLANRLGEWPLLLKLVNATLFRRSEIYGLEKALDYVEQALVRRGIIAFDAQRPERRGQAVAATLKISFNELNDGQELRFRELAVFPEDTDVPLSAVLTLWEASGGLDDFESKELCSLLYDRSLLLFYNEESLRLHDVVRQFLLNEWGAKKVNLHKQLLNAYNKEEEWLKGPDDGYYFQFLAYHLRESGRDEELQRLLLDFNWLQIRLEKSNINDLLADFLLINLVDHNLELVKGALQLSANILLKDKSQLAGQLRGRLLSFTDVKIQSLLNQADRWRGNFWFSPQLPCLTQSGGSLIQTLTGHSGPILSVAVTSDGKQVVSGSYDGRLKVWNLETGEAVWSLEGHTGRVQVVAITPDGKQAISASSNGTVKVWNLGTGLVKYVYSLHLDWLNVVALTANGRWVVSTLRDGTLGVWDREAGRPEEILEVQSDGVRAVAVTPDCKQIATVLSDGTLKVWHLERDGTEPKFQRLKSGLNEVVALALTPDGRWVITASQDQMINLWNLENGEVEQTLEVRSTNMNAIAVTYNGKRAVSADDDGMLKVWNLDIEVKERKLESHSGLVEAVVLTGSNLNLGPRGVSASVDGTLKIWDLETGTGQSLEIHLDKVFAMTLIDAETNDNCKVVSASDDRTIKVWDLKTGEVEQTLADPSAFVLAIASFGRQVVSAFADGTLRIWDLKTGETKLMPEGHSSSVNAVEVTPDGHRMVSASDDGVFKVWNLNNKEKVEQVFELQSSGGVMTRQALAISPDGGHVVLASRDGELKIWNLELGEVKWITGHIAKVWAVKVTSDGRWIVSASRDRTLKVWDLRTGSEMATFFLEETPYCLAVASDRATILVGDTIGQVFWFNLREMSG